MYKYTDPSTCFRFNLLPSFVKIVLTARMQLGQGLRVAGGPGQQADNHAEDREEDEDRDDTAKFFSGWSPDSINPEGSQNMEDMNRLFTLRLEGSGGLVPASQREEVVKVLVRKSKVRDTAHTRNGVYACFH